MSNTAEDKSIANGHKAWLDRLCEAISPSCDKVEELFREQARLKTQAGSLEEENKVLRKEVERLNIEATSLRATNVQLQSQITNVRLARNGSVDALAANLNRIDINVDRANEGATVAKLIQRRFERARHQLQISKRRLAQECPQTRLGAVGYAIRCADVLLDSLLVASTTADGVVHHTPEQRQIVGSREWRRIFLESLMTLDKHLQGLSERLRKISARWPYFLLDINSEPISCSLMLLTLPSPLQVEDVNKKQAAAPSFASTTVEALRSEALWTRSNSFRRTCAVLVCSDIPIAKTLSGRTDYAEGRAFRNKAENDVPFLNESYWYEQSLLLVEELGFCFPESEKDFHASHAEIHLLTFLHRTTRCIPFVECVDITQSEGAILSKGAAMIYVSEEPCEYCQDFCKILGRTGLKVNLQTVPTLQGRGSSLI